MHKKEFQGTIEFDQPIPKYAKPLPLFPAVYKDININSEYAQFYLLKGQTETPVMIALWDKNDNVINISELSSLTPQHIVNKHKKCENSEWNEVVNKAIEYLNKQKISDHA